jgi:hypothetical protein
LSGAFLAFAMLGGLGEWSNWQFIGFFGCLELGVGLASIVGPNIWQLPVQQANKARGSALRLTAAALLTPQWEAVAKVLAGLAMVGAAGRTEGFSTASLTVIPGVILVAAAVLALSLVVARCGVARPDVDVVSFVVRRPGHPDWEVPALSLGGVVIQVVTQFGLFPLVELAPPSILYHPWLAPSEDLLLSILLVAAGLVATASVLWRARFDWR